ncbi:MAG TPA: AraC family transcriptional regulator ligand-binding domain-containing protein [Hyphomonadaceae bacterium]|jgi:AraC-like DNA-binding protein|nr:AraC family transcriptional regulator ligand-binding domain-containing protein [Hyphomonadaceae bacterium]
MAIRTVAAGHPKALADYAASRGANRRELLKRSSLAEADLAAPDSRVPVAKYVAMLDAAALLLDAPGIALEFGAAVMMEDISIVGLVCAAAETVGEGRRQLNRYARLMIDDGQQMSEHLELVRRQDGIWLEATSQAFIDHPRLVECAFARCLTGAKRLMASTPCHDGARAFPHEIHFAHPAPPHRAVHARIFGVPLVFGAGRNAFRVSEDFLNFRLPPSNRYVFGVLSERAEALLKSLEGSRTARGQVESLLMRCLHTGEASMDIIAGKMGVSRQTLLRRLKAEGVTFETVLDELRHRLALHYLSGKRVSVNETAYLVGFSDPASFSRAFKRWTGASPSSVSAATVKT